MNLYDLTSKTPVGEVFEYNGTKYEVIDLGICGQCDFHNPDKPCLKSEIGCGIVERYDTKNVMFKKVEELKIHE